jgi:hypothetical protein
VWYFFEMAEGEFQFGGTVLRATTVRERDIHIDPFVAPPNKSILPSWVEKHSVIRVLLIFANPNGTHPLRLQSEEKCIREALRQGEHGDRVVVDVLAACTIDELAQKLMNSSYEIIHFSGHADRTATLLKHIVEVLQREYHVDHSSFLQHKVKTDLAATAEALVQELEAQLIRAISSENPSAQVSHVYHGDFTKSISLFDEQTSVSGHLVHRSQSNQLDIQIPLTIRELPVKLKERSEEGKVPETIPLSVTRDYSFHDLVGIGVGSLAFESEAGGVNFMCPLSFAKLVSETCPPLQCVILNACAGHIQAEILSRVIPLTICFTGRVSDKESIMFSKGFYESIACGRALDDAFKDGSRRVEIHSLSSGMPNRNGPGVNNFCNLSTGTPLMTLIRNAALIDKVLDPPPDMTASPPLDRFFKHRLDHLEKENKALAAENSELKSLIQYGLGLLKQKDETVGELKESLSEILSTLKSSDKPKRPQNQSLGSGKRILSSTGEGAASTGARRGKGLDRTPQKRRNLKYHHVKSSGYGKRSISVPQGRKDTRASPVTVSATAGVPSRSPHRQPASPSSRIPVSHSSRKDEGEARKSISVLEPDSSLATPPVPMKTRPKSASQGSSQIPVFKSRPPPVPSPAAVAVESSVVIKPTAWSKSYQNLDYEDSLKLEIQRLSDSSEKRLHQPSSGSSSSKYSNRSSEGWREFLKERREVASRLKPSSSFASSVPRFDPNNASSIDSLL